LSRDFNVDPCERAVKLWGGTRSGVSRRILDFSEGGVLEKPALSGRPLARISLRRKMIAGKPMADNNDGR
jgi:hypothetical protein